MIHLPYHRRLLKVPVILTGLLLVAPAVLKAQPSILNELLTHRAALVEVQAKNLSLYRSPPGPVALDAKTGRLIVRQNVKQASYFREGAGVIIHPSGVIVTNAHIVHRAGRITVVMPDKNKLNAQVVGFINAIDLALLKVSPPSDLPWVRLADSDQIRLGDEIFTVGHSFLLNQTVSGGKVIGLGTSRAAPRQGHRRTELIQTTFNLYEGDSGGPLFNNRGQLIGLMTAKETKADHSSFAVPSNRIAQYLKEYLQNQGLAPAP